MTALQRWRDLLASWAIPATIDPPESPWVLPREVFRRRADRQIADPIGATHRLAVEALREPGTVLDIGAAAGAASLPLVSRSKVTAVTALDTDDELLAAFAERAAGVEHRLLSGRWPDLAAEAGTADVVVCGNVVYNVPDLAPFAAALTAAARRRVVVELAARHPLTELNPLWQRFHGIARPTGPTVEDCLAALAEVGIEPQVVAWQRPPEPEYAKFTTLVDVARRRLCLPLSAAGDVEQALLEMGVDPAVPPDLGSSGRDLVTLVWPGSG
ncbi:class I SAM-dependent methyltransferase [Amycolatopsis benzoatilytica]|uniref:class I SAM-dependent methyltransferase n=1 Tax=Amycolatopsis benzoatilytica TaxID=346045 RepID=UPI00036E76A7|nr:class I SAM-dependent methyltransferase [Amycolatopsis benzoatilytica]